MSVVCASARGHVGIHDAIKTLLGAATPAVLMFKVCAAVGKGSMLIIVIHTATGDHADVCDQVCLPQETVASVATLPLETTCKSVIHAAAGCYEPGSFFCSGINDYGLLIENERY